MCACVVWRGVVYNTVHMHIYVVVLDSVECSVMCVVPATIYFRDMCIIHIIQVLLCVACHMHLNCNKVLAHIQYTHTHTHTYAPVSCTYSTSVRWHVHMTHKYSMHKYRQFVYSCLPYNHLRMRIWLEQCSIVTIIGGKVIIGSAMRVGHLIYLL